MLGGWCRYKKIFWTPSRHCVNNLWIYWSMCKFKLVAFETTHSSFQLLKCNIVMFTVFLLKLINVLTWYCLRHHELEFTIPTSAVFVASSLTRWLSACTKNSPALHLYESLTITGFTQLGLSLFVSIIRHLGIQNFESHSKNFFVP